MIPADMTLIYLADLTHTTITVSNDSFPLGAGMVAAYALEQFPGLEVELFKYPERLKSAIQRRPPDVLGLSNYPWNLDLGASLLEYAKRLRPETLTVMGGPNVPYQPSLQRRLLERIGPALDFHTLFEGETAFAGLLELAESVGLEAEALKAAQPRGVIYLRDGELGSYQPIPRARDLSAYPSPYQAGLFDPFFDDVLSPMLETHRGCPYRCTFCHEGHLDYTKVARFPSERLLADLDYIAARVGDKVKNLLIADPNFGMFPRDLELARHLRALRERTGFPATIFATTAKNASSRLIEISEVFGDQISMPIWMSVQSMDEQVLGNIKRRNIKVSHMITVQQALTELGANSKSELILCLPGETLETHTASLIKLMSLGIDQVVSYQLMLVNGSEMSVDASLHADPQQVTRFRVLPRSFTRLDDVRPSLETEEVVVATKDLPFEDYLRARQLHLLVSIFYNSKAFKGFFKLLDEEQLSLEAFLGRLLERFVAAPELTRLHHDFLAETRGELFETEAEVRAFFAVPQHFAELCAGTRGGNLLQRFTCAAYLEVAPALVQAVSGALLDVAAPAPLLEAKVRELADFYRLSFKDLADPGRRDRVDEAQFTYDIPGWLNDSRTLDVFRLPTPVLQRFHTPPEQFEQVESYFERYGRGPHALGKILTRLWIVDLFRQPQPPEPAARTSAAAPV